MEESVLKGLRLFRQVPAAQEGMHTPLPVHSCVATLDLVETWVGSQAPPRWKLTLLVVWSQGARAWWNVTPAALLPFATE